MATTTQLQLDGSRGKLAVRRWENPEATYVAVLVHGIGEHSGRYGHVAQAFLVGARYGQAHGDKLAALVLSAPVVGGNPDLLGMVDLPEIPDIPIDPEWLS